MQHQDPGGAPITAVATILTPTERQRVDAAGEGLYRTLHRESIDEVLADLRARRADAVLVSVQRCGAPDASRVALMVREFPRVPAVALVTDLLPGAAQVMLTLGRSGVRTVIDVRQNTGWRDLRNVLLAEYGTEIQRAALAQLQIDLAGASSECWHFFERLFRARPPLATVRALARQMGIVPSTLMSRFFRAKLPAPKRYIAMARLVRAARLFENPGLSVAAVANHLDYSSPQSFGRHVRSMLGMTGSVFRERYDGDAMFQRFREDLVTPYLGTLRHFDPLIGPTPVTSGSEGLRQDRS